MSAPVVPDVDLEQETLDELALRCEVVSVYVRDNVAYRRERCPNEARWIVRSWCHCGRTTIDLVCDDDVRKLGKFVHRCGGCQCMAPPARQVVEPL